MSATVPARSEPAGAPGILVAIDTAGTWAVVAVGRLDGALIEADRWRAGYRHGEEVLARLDGLLGRTGLRLEDVRGVVVGTGPGAFTGLRVGLATAKALAVGLGVPIAGVATSDALLEAALAAPDAAAVGSAARRSAEPAAPRLPYALMLPAGPSDRVVVRQGEPPALVPGGLEPELAAGTTVVAVDLAGRADPDAVARGERAGERLASELLALGSRRLAAGAGDDIAGLVPEYVTLPRGVQESAGEVRWSRDLR